MANFADKFNHSMNIGHDYHARQIQQPNFENNRDPRYFQMNNSMVIGNQLGKSSIIYLYLPSA